MFVPLKITSLGVTNVDFCFTTLDNVSVKILEFSKFKLIEFRKKEFRIAIDSEDDLFEYEIFKNIKNQKLKYVFEFFTNLFHVFSTYSLHAISIPFFLLYFVLYLSYTKNLIWNKNPFLERRRKHVCY